MDITTMVATTVLDVVDCSLPTCHCYILDMIMDSLEHHRK